MIVALCGNQNAGKTTLFNLLTGAAEHVGNYPGVTVEQRVGRLLPTYQQGANGGADRRSARRVFVDSIFARGGCDARIYSARKARYSDPGAGRNQPAARTVPDAGADGAGAAAGAGAEHDRSLGKIRRHAGCPASTGASGRALHIHQRPHRARRAAVDGRGHAGGKGRAKRPLRPCRFPWNRCPRRSTASWHRHGMLGSTAAWPFA